MTGPVLLPVADRRTPLLLGVYGTLRRGCRNSHLMAGCPPVADGVVAGVLHEVRASLRLDYGYPLLQVASGSDRTGGADVVGEVLVEVYRVLDTPTLDALDELEDYDPDDPAGSEYVRVRVPVRARGGGPVAGVPEVQVYAYAGAADGRGAVLPGGDWYVHAGPLR